MLEILNMIKTGELSPEEGLLLLQQQPIINKQAEPDFQREARCGFPEVIYGASKTAVQITDILAQLKTHSVANLLITGVSAEKFRQIAVSFPTLTYFEAAQMAVLFQQSAQEIGLIAVITAGTSDIPIAEQAVVTAQMMGAKVERFYDVGVAGIHRLLDKATDLQKANVCIVIAGMEGALASVVGGLVACPVIAVPTSIGYGASFGGLCALLAMLNSCSAGIATVNIDNGFGAGYLAAVINKQSTK